MFSFDGMKPVDLSPRIKARAYLVDGTIQEGNLDPNGKPWVMVEGRYAGDNSLFKLFRAPPGGDDVWPRETNNASWCLYPRWRWSYKSLVRSPL